VNLESGVRDDQQHVEETLEELHGSVERVLLEHDLRRKGRDADAWLDWSLVKRRR
jgi:hypothetical protein